MNLETLLQKAIEHRHSHDCSAYPYEEDQRLVEYLNQYKPSKVLEIGTGIGYSSAVLAQSMPLAIILTIEKDLEHSQMAREFLNSANISESQVTIINELAEQYLAKIKTTFDFIFFDGYQIHYEFLPHYHRLLNSNGILFLANNHLKSRTSAQFFEELNTSSNWDILEQFADTTVVKRV